MTHQGDPLLSATREAAGPALRLYRGVTEHARFVPFERRFRYGITLVDLDIGRIDEAEAQTRHFRVGHRALFWLRPHDHGPRDGTDWRAWTETMLAAAGVDLQGGAVRLITFPRHAFYRFAPISLWTGYGPDGVLRGVVYEVNNTFGETHAYAAAVSDTQRDVHEAEKSFHVSPFMAVDGAYRFTLRPPGDVLSLVVDNMDADTRTHMANIRARAVAATDAAFLRAAVASPFASLGVTFAIHWQAIKIMLSGGRYHRKPPPPAQPVTIARHKTSRPV